MLVPVLLLLVSRRRAKAMAMARSHSGIKRRGSGCLTTIPVFTVVKRDMLPTNVPRGRGLQLLCLQATPKGPKSLVQLQSSGPVVEHCAAVVDVPKFCGVSSLLGEIDVLSAAIEHTSTTVVLSDIDYDSLMNDSDNECKTC